jgi:hypothetical protein
MNTGIITEFKKMVSAIANKFYKVEFGQNGFLDISDTSAHPGYFNALKAEGTANAVIATAVTEFGDDLSSYTLNPGDIVYGPFTSVTLTSGEVLAYYVNKVD